MELIHPITRLGHVAFLPDVIAIKHRARNVTGNLHDALLFHSGVRHVPRSGMARVSQRDAFEAQPPGGPLPVCRALPSVAARPAFPALIVTRPDLNTGHVPEVTEVTKGECQLVG